MKKIAFIGAGSVTFAKNLLNDFLLFEIFRDAEFRLMDIDRNRLDFAENTMITVNNRRKANAKFKITQDRKEALADADFVITMIQVGSNEATKIDFDICRKHGLKFTIADTMGVGGISRALRTIPVMLDICRDMEQVCPDAYLLNYTNPMGMLMASTMRSSKIKSIGLCHGVFGTAGKIADLINVDIKKVNYLCAGINHLAFFLKYEADGKDAYPLIKKAFDGKYKQEELVRQEIYRRFGYFMTESSEHLSEYLPYFIKSDELVKEYDIPIDEYLHRSEENVEIYNQVDKAFKEGINILAEGGKVKITPKSRMRKRNKKDGEDVVAFEVTNTHSGEYASKICNAIVTDESFAFNGNLLNRGLITNLPNNTCVEVPCLVNKNGIQPTVVGDLPPQCAALIQTNLNVQDLVTRGMLEQNRDYIYHAALLSPLASAVLSTKTICSLMDDLLETHKEIIPSWLF